MSIFSRLTNLATFGLSGSIFGIGGGDKKKKDPYEDLLSQLTPLIEQNKQISGAAGKEGLANVGAAREDLDYVSKYLKSLLEGSDDDLLKLFDSSEVTRGIDENVEQLSELGVRGGRRAAVLGQQNFDRDSSISRIISQLRFGAPDKMASVAQVLGNLGLGELSASSGASAGASNVLFGVEGLKQADKDRKAELIGSIFEAIGAVAGTVACVARMGSHYYVPAGKISAHLVKIGDDLLSYTLEGEPIVRKVIRIRETPRQLTKIISNGNTIIRVTPTHTFLDVKFDSETIAGTVEDGDALSFVNGDRSKLSEKNVKVLGEEFNDVHIVKVGDEEKSYPIVVNGYLCLDDDPLGNDQIEGDYKNA